MWKATYFATSASALGTLAVMSRFTCRPSMAPSSWAKSVASPSLRAEKMLIFVFDRSLFSELLSEILFTNL